MTAVLQVPETPSDGLQESRTLQQVPDRRGQGLVVPGPSDRGRWACFRGKASRVAQPRNFPPSLIHSLPHGSLHVSWTNQAYSCLRAFVLPIFSAPENSSSFRHLQAPSLKSLVRQPCYTKAATGL